MLPDRVVARQVPRVDAGEVRRLEAAGLAVAVGEQPRAVRAGHQVAEIIWWQRCGMDIGSRGPRQGWGQLRACVHVDCSL